MSRDFAKMDTILGIFSAPHRQGAVAAALRQRFPLSLASRISAPLCLLLLRLSGGSRVRAAAECAARRYHWGYIE